jgi:hypothetical protein
MLFKKKCSIYVELGVFKNMIDPDDRLFCRFYKICGNNHLSIFLEGHTITGSTNGLGQEPCEN